MSATDNLSTPQFGSVSKGTYDAVRHREWNDEHFRPVRQAQYSQIRSVHTADLASAQDARERGDRPAAARALTKAASSRHMVAGWTHLKR